MTAAQRTHRRTVLTTAAGVLALLLLLWGLWSRPVSPPYDLLLQFSLTPRQYRHASGQRVLPLRYSAADGSLVGTQIDAVGGRLRLAICRTAEGGFCGFNLRRIGATWFMRAPMPLPAE